MEEYQKQGSINFLKIEFENFLTNKNFKIISDKKFENKTQGCITTITFNDDYIEIKETRLYNSINRDTFYIKEFKLENKDLLNYSSNNEIYFKLQKEIEKKFLIVTTFLKLEYYFETTEEGFTSYNQPITDTIVFEKKHDEYTEKFLLEDLYLKWNVNTQPGGGMQIAKYDDLKDLSGTQIVEFMRKFLNNNNNCD